MLHLCIIRYHIWANFLLQNERKWIKIFAILHNTIKMQKPLSFGELAARYEQGRTDLINQVSSFLTHTEPGDQTGRAVFKHHKTGKLVTFDELGRLVPYKGGKKTRRKANKKRKHSNNSRYRR
jgi:hypothetical protein